MDKTIELPPDYPVPGVAEALDRCLKRVAELPPASRPTAIIAADDGHAGLIRERIRVLGLELDVPIELHGQDRHRPVAER